VRDFRSFFLLGVQRKPDIGIVGPRPSRRLFVKSRGFKGVTCPKRMADSEKEDRTSHKYQYNCQIKSCQNTQNTPETRNSISHGAGIE